MKKFLTVILSLILCFGTTFAFGCSPATTPTYSFMVPDGAPALAVAKMISDGDGLGLDRAVSYSVIKAEQVSPNLSSGKPDIMVAPVNLASKLYKSHNYVMVAVLTHGNFYIVSTTEISVNDLVGKQIAVPNMGAVPDWTLKMVLSSRDLSFVNVLETGANDPSKVNIKYYTEGKDVVSAIMGGSQTIGLVPEPAASNLEKKYCSVKGQSLYRLDLQELYDSQEKAYSQAVLMVKKSLLDANPELVNTLEDKITQSASWVKNNIGTAVNAINEKGGATLDANALTESAIDGCKIYWQSAENAKISVKNYINKIVDIDSNKATAVSDDFFYSISD